MWREFIPDGFAQSLALQLSFANNKIGEIYMSSGPKFCLLLLAGFTATAAQAAAEYRYTMLFSGHVGGEHVTRIADDGSITTDFSYRENGRGPDLKEKLKL